MKAVLVIDEMPITCLSCPFALSHICEGSKQTIGEIMTDMKVRHESCPLRPLPKGITNYEVRVSCDYDADYAEGWNDYLKEITE